MLKIIMVSLCLLLSINCFSQNNNEKDQEVDMVMYKVQLGETIRLISRKYFVTPSQIYKYNKFAIEGITEGMLLYIPVPKKETVYTENKETKAPKSATKATVDKKEIVVKEVSNDRMNQVISKADEALKATNNQSSILTNNNVAINDDSKTVTHRVKSHETLFGLSKEYNITVDELKEQNQKVLKNGLQVGQVLTIKKNN